jgi:YMGG-like Gly-zipper
MTKFVTGLFLMLCSFSAFALGDSLELKNGSLIKGKYVGGDANTVSFEVGSTVQKYNVADIQTLTFEASTRSVAAAPSAPKLAPRPPAAVRLTPDPESADLSTTQPRSSRTLTVPAGTEINVRMIDSVDSETNRIGDRFQASLEEPLVVDGVTVAPKNANIYGRLSEAKEAGRVAGSSQLKLELTGIVLNGETVPLLTGEYELTGKGRGSNTAKKAAGGAAIGAVIGAIAGGGKGAAIGAGVGAGAGTTINVITKGEQVKVPSETLLSFTLQQPLNLKAPATDDRTGN